VPGSESASRLFDPLQSGTRVQIERLTSLCEVEHLLELVRTMNDVRLSSSPACGNVLDGFGREYQLRHRRIRVLHVLVHEAIDVKLAQDDSLPCTVEAEPALIFMNLALRILLLGGGYSLRLRP
jgi:hypothetical protein